MDFKPKNEILTEVCQDCGKRKPAEDATEHSQALCHCPAPAPSNVISLKVPADTARPENAPPDPHLFGNDYEVLAELGVGSLTKAYKAQRKNATQPLTIKVLRSEFADNPRTVKRFRLEAERACNLNHPNVAAVYDVGTTSSGLPFIVTDFLEGINIDEYLKKEGFFSEPEAIDAFIQVCDGLRDAHKKGLIHRDLKPKNIILKKTGKDAYLVKVADFGIAKVLPNPGRETKYYTPEGDSFGDAQYMSPEQCMGKRLDARSDIYALGCLMYQCISGKPPFSSSNAMRLAMKQINEAPARLSDRFVDLDISPGIEHVIMRALEKDPEDRYQSVAEMAKDLALVKIGKTPRPVPRRAVPPPPVAPQAVRKDGSSNAAAPRQKPRSLLNWPQLTAGELSDSGRYVAPIANFQLIRFVRKHRMLSGALAGALLTCAFFLLWTAFEPHIVQPPSYQLPLVYDMERQHPMLDTNAQPQRPILDAILEPRSGQPDLFEQSPIVLRTVAGKQIYCAAKETVKEAVEEAVANGIDLSGVQLQGVNLSNANLSGAQFSGANLANSKFTNANLTRAQFSQANVFGATFSRANLTDAIVTNSNLENTQWTHADLSRSVWNANMMVPLALHLSNSNPYLVTDKCYFPNLKTDDRNQQRLRQINLRNLHTQQVLFTCQAKSVSQALSMAVAKHMDLEGIDLRGTNLTGANLANAKLSNAHFEGATIRKCDLTGAVLNDAFMQGATISDSSLADAILVNVSLQGAVLSHVDFSGANLLHCNRSATTFSSCFLENEKPSDNTPHWNTLDYGDFGRADLPKPPM